MAPHSFKFQIWSFEANVGILALCSHCAAVFVCLLLFICFPRCLPKHQSNITFFWSLAESSLGASEKLKILAAIFCNSVCLVFQDCGMLTIPSWILSYYQMI